MKTKRGLEPVAEEEGPAKEQTVTQVLTRAVGRARVGRAANPSTATEEELIEISDVEGFRQVLEMQASQVDEEDAPPAPVKRFPPWLTELIRRIKAIPPTGQVDYNLLRQAIT
jgi:hypothetical protein